MSVICNLQSQIASLQAQITALEAHEHDATEQRQIIQIHAEQNGAITGGRQNYSWGNGNESTANADLTDSNGWGWVAHYDGRVISLSVGTRLRNTADLAVGLTVNNVDSSGEVRLIGDTVFTGCNEVDIPFVQHDVLNFYTKEVGGGNDVVVSALLELTLP